MNRRGLFGWLAGAYALPFVKRPVAAAAPEAQFWGDKIKITQVSSTTFIPSPLYPTRVGALYEPMEFPDALEPGFVWKAEPL